MKTIIITRHAKSDWSTIGQQDYDRPLNARGERDAPMMGDRLKAKNIPLDTIISSTAQRAKSTALHIASAIQFNTNHIQWLDELYHAPAHLINDVIASIDDTYQSAMIVCHNPGITYWVLQHLGNITDNVPTCGMCAIQFDSAHWSDFYTAKKRFYFYDYPKNGR